jgi:hypothetical protein
MLMLPAAVKDRPRSCSVARSFRVDEMIVIVTQRNWRLSSTATLRVEDG